jgi:DNA invertase Pin-like site-specific DNA recombinase
MQSPPVGRLIPAAEYLRMSTDHQQYSIANQAAVIALYAAAHGLGIVRSFTDEGKTGRTIHHRQGLQNLLAMVESGEADFKHVLVYDVSRWGRFEDADESAHYEYLCKRAGITVRYCAEQFENDNSPTSNLLKALKRTMASEFSRELSVKVSAGQRRLVSMGFWQGGNGPFGYQRFLVSAEGTPKHLLKFREWKSIHTDRITLVPGPKQAVDTIRLAYDLYTKKRKSRPQIVEILNKRGVYLGKVPWTLAKVRWLLQNPIYKGAYAYAKHYGHYLHAPRDKWLVKENAFPAIIHEKQWQKAYDRIRDEIKPLIKSEMVEALKRLWKREGKLNTNTINAAKDTPSVPAYCYHFGGLNEAYKKIGYPVIRDLTWLRAIRVSNQIRRSICEEICAKVNKIGGIAVTTPIRGELRINHNVTVKVAVRRAWVKAGRETWILFMGKQIPTDILVMARVRPPDKTVLDYFVFPRVSQLRGALRYNDIDSPPYLELCHYRTLDELVEMFRLCSIRNAA